MSVHPGDLLLREVLLPANLSVLAAAERLNVPAELLADIVCGKLPVTVEVAAALAREFGFSRERWLQLQAAWDKEQLLLA
jgi:addiction module HigA family antidote